MSRIYTDFKTAMNEVRRDVKEMGTKVHTRTMQDKVIAEDDDFATLELTNVIYTITNPLFIDLSPVQPWATLEWAERKAGIEGEKFNPGMAWQTRQDETHNWREFLELNGVPLTKDQINDEIFIQNALAADQLRFSYAYGERFGDQVRNVIEALKTDPMTRQAWVSIWYPTLDNDRLQKRRVPCTLGYHFMFRGGQLNINYVMRSCDIFTHYQNDLYLALQLLHYVAERVNLPVGQLTHTVFSLHAYAKNLKEVF